MNYWLIKSEPSVFSIDDLAKSKNQTTCWDGIRSYAEIPAIAGICEVVKEAYPDLTAFDPKNEYYDPKSKKDNPAWFMVDVKFVKKFTNLVSLEQIKKNKKLENIKLLKIGRLSVMPVTKEEFDEVVKMSK
jgi:predicted RNA-binding protein with PUA-like domain